jgi:hypothetical protein
MVVLNCWIYFIQFYYYKCKIKEFNIYIYINIYKYKKKLTRKKKKKIKKVLASVVKLENPFFFRMIGLHQ